MQDKPTTTRQTPEAQIAPLMDHPALAEPNTARRRRKLLVQAGLIMVGLILAGVVFAMSSQVEDARSETAFSEAVANRAGELEKEVSSVGEVLHALRAFYNSSDKVTRSEFATFAAAPLRRLDSVHAVAWVPIVEDGDRAAHIHEALTDGAPADYTIRTLRGEPAPVGRLTFPVMFVEPATQAALRLGQDLGSVAAFGAAMAHASASDQPVLSDAVHIGDADAPALALMFLSVRDHSAGSTGEVNGFVVLALAPAELLRAPTHGMVIALDDPDVSGRVHRLSGDADLQRASAMTQQRVHAAGQTWLLVANATPGYMQGRATLWPWALAALTFLLWLLLIASGYLIARRGREEALRRHDRTMEGVLANLEEGVVVTDARGNLLFCNKAAERILGRRADVGASGSWSLSFGCFLADTQTPIPEDRMPIVRALLGEATPEREIFLRNPSTPRGRWITVSGTPMRTERGDLRGAMMVMRDVSDQKRSKQAIRRLSRAVNHTADAIYIADPKGEIIYVNKAFERMTGHPRPDAVGGHFQDVGLGAGDPEHFVQLRAALVEERGFRGTTANMHKAGRVWFGEQTLTPMRDAKGTLTNWVGVCRDMTERMRIEEQRIEMDLASSVQRKLYPLKAPRMLGFDVAGAVFSADATCGDYFDFIELSDNRVAIVIGDVSGHGLGPAFVMSQVRAYLRSYLELTDDLSEVFGRVNRALCRDFDGDFFVTLMVTVLDLESRAVHYCNAAHIPAYILDETGALKATLKRTGLPLGLFETSEYTVGNGVALEVGDVAVLLTDGVVEARSPDGECLWEEGAVEVVRSHVGQGSAEIVERIYERVRSHSRGRAQDDDITMVVVKSIDPSSTYVRPAPQQKLKTGKQGTIACRAH